MIRKHTQQGIGFLSRAVVFSGKRSEVSKVSMLTEALHSILPKLLTVEDLCAYLDRSCHTLQKWRVEGNGPRYRRIGNRIFYAESDVLAWIEACGRDSTSDS